MKIKLLLPVLLAPVLFLPGCIPHVQQQNYYVSPLNGNQGEYHALPQLTDSAHTAVYAHVGYAGGKANQEKTDYYHSFRGAITVAHHYGAFQFYYGLDLSLGNYFLGKWDTGHKFLGPITDPPAATAILNSFSGGRFYGGVGFSGGMNVVLPISGGEWRILGIETDMHHEFGDYLSFRKNLADSLAALNIRNSFYATVGLTTEMIGRTGNGEFGFRMALGQGLGPYYHTNVYDYESKHFLNYSYFDLSFHYTWDQYTAYLQSGWAEQANSFQIGLQYRLGQPRLSPKVSKGSKQR